MDVAINLGLTLGFLAVSAVFALGIGIVARRVLGTAVGWPRSVIVGVIVFWASMPFANFVVVQAGLLRGGGSDPVSPDLSVPWPIAVVFIALALAWVFAFGVTALVVIEAVWPTGSIPTPVQWFHDFRSRQRRARRYAQVLLIASRHGLSRFLRRGAGELDPDAQTARSIVAALNDAGVTFVKLGQMIGTRRDIVPPVYARELARLQSAAAPVDWVILRRFLADELGEDPDVRFAWVDPVPIAAASVAQVHRACLHDGTEVVLKIQRPSAAAEVAVDVDIILRLARTIERRTVWGKNLGAETLARGFVDSLTAELDYRAERENTQMLGAALAETPQAAVVVPRVFEEHSGPRVLTLELLDGVPLSEAARELATLPRDQGTALATGLYRSVLHTILVAGVFHADLHPGNVFLLRDGRVGLLDFGAVGILDAETRQLLAALLLSIARDDNISAVDALLMVVTTEGRPDIQRLRRDVGEVMTVMRYRPRADSALLSRLFGILQRHGLQLPAQVAVALRSLGSVEESLLRLDPSFETVAHTRDEAAGLLRRLLAPRAVAGLIEAQSAVTLASLRRMPHRLEQVSAELASGRFSLRLSPFSDAGDRRWLRLIVDDGIAALVATAAVVAAILLIVSNTGPFIAPEVRFHTLTGYALAFFGFVLGLRSVVRIFARFRQ